MKQNLKPTTSVLFFGLLRGAPHGWSFRRRRRRFIADLGGVMGFILPALDEAIGS